MKEITYKVQCSVDVIDSKRECRLEQILVEASDGYSGERQPSDLPQTAMASKGAATTGIQSKNKAT